MKKGIRQEIVNLLKDGPSRLAADLDAGGVQIDLNFLIIAMQYLVPFSQKSTESITSSFRIVKEAAQTCPNFGKQISPQLPKFQTNFPLFDYYTIR